jgi:hypothetical protein
MYEFAIVALLGIGTMRLVETAGEYRDLSAVRSLLSLAVGVLASWALDFSLFSAWGVPVRSELLGYVGTGVMIAAAGYAIPQVLGTVAELVGPRRELRVERAA